jgi:membrane protein required for colicin V production
MNYLDVIIAVPLLWGMYKGWQRGLIFEIAMIIGLILGFYVAFKFSSMFEGIVKKFVDSPSTVLPYITFFIVFILVIVVMVLLAKFLEGILKASKLTPINQVAGAIFGTLKFALTVSVILAIIRPVDVRMGLFTAKTKSESVLYQPVLKISHYLFPALEDVREEFGKRVGS